MAEPLQNLRVIGMGRHIVELHDLRPHRPHAPVDFNLFFAARKPVAGFEENTTHHGYRPDKDPGERAKETFAYKLAAWLDGAAHDDVFGRLVIAAPPHMLGELRKAMSKQVNTRVVAEVSKDLAKHSEPELRAALAEILWF